jgi:TetR/AcrR family transcriptional regulator, transcriptional repressor for nem operon
VKGLLLERWLGLLERFAGDPVTALQRTLQHRAVNPGPHEIELGCPLNNLAQEMSPLDERFRRAVNATFDAWKEGFTRVLERGQAEGSVRRDVDARKVASFVVAAVEGSSGLAKSAQSATMLRSNLTVLSDFLESLRPAARERRRKPSAKGRAAN